MNGAMSNPNAEDLRVGTTGQQLFSGSETIITHLKSSTFNVDCDNPPMIICFDFRAHPIFVDFVSTLSKLFLAVAGLSNCHQLDLISTVLSYCSLDDRLYRPFESRNTAEQFRDSLRCLVISHSKNQGFLRMTLQQPYPSGFSIN
jgi:hypothetical protein